MASPVLCISPVLGMTEHLTRDEISYLLCFGHFVSGIVDRGSITKAEKASLEVFADEFISNSANKRIACSLYDKLHEIDADMRALQPLERGRGDKMRLALVAYSKSLLLFDTIVLRFRCSDCPVIYQEWESKLVECARILVARSRAFERYIMSKDIVPTMDDVAKRKVLERNSDAWAKIKRKMSSVLSIPQRLIVDGVESSCRVVPAYVSIPGAVVEHFGFYGTSLFRSFCHQLGILGEDYITALGDKQMPCEVLAHRALSVMKVSNMSLPGGINVVHALESLASMYPALTISVHAVAPAISISYSWNSRSNLLVTGPPSRVLARKGGKTVQLGTDGETFCSIISFHSTTTMLPSQYLTPFAHREDKMRATASDLVEQLRGLVAQNMYEAPQPKDHYAPGITNDVAGMLRPSKGTGDRRRNAT